MISYSEPSTSSFISTTWTGEETASDTAAACLFILRFCSGITVPLCLYACLCPCLLSLMCALLSVCVSVMPHPRCTLSPTGWASCSDMPSSGGGITRVAISSSRSRLRSRSRTLACVSLLPMRPCQGIRLEPHSRSFFSASRSVVGEVVMNQALDYVRGGHEEGIRLCQRW
jgi:hypothetical protein